jgi:hypothetical protein
MLFDSSVDDDKIIKYKINYENENIKNKIK